MSTHQALEIGKRLTSDVLGPMKQLFVGKDEIIDLMGVCLAGGENLFILGPPGTAKSALVHELGRRIHGDTFEYLLTRFTEPNELFGPFDIRKLREGVLETNSEGMLPEASLVFLDELLNANSAILNSVLTVLNERVLRRGREVRQLPLLMVVGASNHLPEEEALQALFDRFLMRAISLNVPDEELSRVLDAGWQLDQKTGASETGISADDIRQLASLLHSVDLEPLRPDFVELVCRLRQAGITVSDRRAVKLQRLISASALLCQRQTAHASDLWVLRHIWDIEEQREILRNIVDETIEEKSTESGDEKISVHPQAQAGTLPDPEALARDLESIERQLIAPPAEGEQTTPRSALRDQLSAISSRTQWIQNVEQRQWLEAKLTQLWDLVEPPQKT